MTPGQTTADEAIARLKQTYDRQAIMAIGGMVLVSAFFVFDANDQNRTMATLLSVLPWFVGIAALVLTLNRWALWNQSKAIRRHFQQIGG